MEHIVRSFDEELKTLLDLTARLGDVALAHIDAALRALAAAGKKTTPGPLDPGELYMAAENQVVRILALRAPMAEDLRFVVSALKIATSLRQTIDHADGILERANRLNISQARHSLRWIRRLGDEVRAMQKDVMAAFQVRDAQAAMAIWHRDQFIDEQHSGLFRELLTYMMEDAKNITACSEMIFISKDIERIGDLATNIAEMIHYLVRGAPVSERRIKSDTAALTMG